MNTLYSFQNGKKPTWGQAIYYSIIQHYFSTIQVVSHFNHFSKNKTFRKAHYTCTSTLNRNSLLISPFRSVLSVKETIYPLLWSSSWALKASAEADNTTTVHLIKPSLEAITGLKYHSYCLTTHNTSTAEPDIKNQFTGSTKQSVLSTTTQ